MFVSILQLRLHVEGIGFRVVSPTLVHLRYAQRLEPLSSEALGPFASNQSYSRPFQVPLKSALAGGDLRR